MRFGRLANLFLGAALAATPAAAEHRLTLSTGEVLRVENLQHVDQRVRFDHPLLGTVTLDQADVVRIDKPKNQADPDPNNPGPNNPGSGTSVPVTNPPDTPPETPPDTPQDPDPDPIKPEPTGLFGTPWLRGWDTNLSLGLSGSSGNTDRQSFTGQFTTRKRNDRRRTLFEAYTFYTLHEGETSQNEARVRLTHDWLMPESRWFVFANGEYEHDQLRDFEHRVAGYGGFGYTFLDNDDWEVLARAGAGANYEFGDVNELMPEALFGGSVFKWDINKHHNLAASATFYPELERDGESRFNLTLDWVIDLPDASGLKLKLGLVNDYDSATTGDEQHNDLKYYTALVLAF